MGRPRGLRKAGLPLAPSLNTGVAFARSDFSDIAPSVTAFETDFATAIASNTLWHWQCDDPPQIALLTLSLSPSDPPQPNL